MSQQSSHESKVLIVGGGFGGLAACKALARAPVAVTVLDRRNHHVFQPLLYQVATAALSPADISSPIRTVLREQKNCDVALAEVHGVDLAARRVLLRTGSVGYDYLVLASGATHSYFGHDAWAAVAPGLKTLEDATELRRRILLAFEAAEFEGSREARRAALTFAIVGGGATGVELAGALEEIAGRTLPADYKHIDTRATRVILFEAADRLLPPFPPELGARAKRDLERMGVEVRLGAKVSAIEPGVIAIGDERVFVRNVFWAAGVSASPLGRSLGVPLDRAGRVIVEPDLTLAAHPEVFVVGDLAAVRDADGRLVPGVAQAAIQMGRYAGERIAEAAVNEQASRRREAFVYRDKGSLAVIGSASAVAQIGRLKLGGWFAWLVWALVHVAFLIGFRNRIQVLLSWSWNWLMNARDSRLIMGDARLDLKLPSASDFQPYAARALKRRTEAPN